MFKVLSYYSDRVNSYDDSLDPENIKKMLTFKEISFITSAEALNSMKHGKPVNPSQLLRQTLTPFGKQLKSITIHKMFNNDGKCLGSKLKSYDNYFSKRGYLSQNPHQILPDGSTVPVTGNIIDMSDCFARQHNLFRSYAVITKINRSILNGKLDYSAETEFYKEELRNQIKLNLSECRTLEEYFSKQSQL